VTEPTRRGTWSRRLGAVPQEGGLLVFLVVLAAWFTWKSEFFLTGNNIRNILLSVSVLGILAAPSTLLLISGNFDLSIGSAAALCGVTFGLVAEPHGLVLAVLAAFGAGLLCGMVNGTLVAYFGISSLIVTLGTLSVFRGIAQLRSNGQTTRLDTFRWLGSGEVLGVPVQIGFFIIVVVIFGVVMRATTFGRSVFAIGSSQQAARLAGIRIRPTVFALFIVSGLLAALAGLILSSQLRAASPNTAAGLELSVVAAVILGGASLNGGRGTIAGTVLGVLILGTLNNGLTILSISSFWQEIARGFVLILAVGVDQIRLRLRGD
jgi:ribose transport system permease protein